MKFGIFVSLAWLLKVLFWAVTIIGVPIAIYLLLTPPCEKLGRKFEESMMKKEGWWAKKGHAWGKPKKLPAVRGETVCERFRNACRLNNS